MIPNRPTLAYEKLGFKPILEVLVHFYIDYSKSSKKYILKCVVIIKYVVIKTRSHIVMCSCVEWTRAEYTCASV